MVHQQTTQATRGDQTSEPQSGRDSAIRAVGEMIDHVTIAMLATTMPDGTLRSRPMARAATAFDGDIWFFTDDDSAKVDDIVASPAVNVSFSDPANQRFLSLSGTAEIVDDRPKLEILWDQRLEEWFPDGPKQQSLKLLKVTVEFAEYWDTPGGTLHQIGSALKSLVTRDHAPERTHGEIRWDRKDA